MKKKKPKKENSERWLLTYSDLITLLMIFFVVMYSMSNVDKAKYSQASQSLKGAFSGTQYVALDGSSGISPSGEGATTAEAVGRQISKTEKLKEDMKLYLETNQLQAKVDMKVEPRGLVITLKENTFFESGRAEIVPGYEKNILEIGKILKQVDNDIVVEGHTDNVPIHNEAFQSNWELASMRAIQVINLLIGKAGVEPEKLSAVSYGEFRPVASNDTIEGRAKNRRIDIVILSSEFYKESQK